METTNGENTVLEFNKLSEAVQGEGYSLKMQLINVKGDYISQMCLIEDATQIIIFHSSSLAQIKSYIKLEFGRKWMKSKELD